MCFFSSFSYCNSLFLPVGLGKQQMTSAVSHTVENGSICSKDSSLKMVKSEYMSKETLKRSCSCYIMWDISLFKISLFVCFLFFDQSILFAQTSSIWKICGWTQLSQFSCLPSYCRWNIYRLCTQKLSVTLKVWRCIYYFAVGKQTKVLIALEKNSTVNVWEIEAGHRRQVLK